MSASDSVSVEQEADRSLRRQRSDMSNLQDLTKFVFTWFIRGAKPCSKCASLNGRQWHGQSLYNPVLLDPVFGAIWDLQNDVPLTHQNCQCYLHVEISVDLKSDPKMMEFLGDLEKCRAT